MKEKKLGEVSHYYRHIKVAIVDLDDEIVKGDKLHFIGHTTDFGQEADSIEHEAKEIEKMPKGHSVGVKVDKAVREHDEVFKLIG